MGAIKRSLEKILGEERFDRLKNNRVYQFCVEALSMNTFSYGIMAPVEMLYVGMDFYTHLNTRLNMVAGNALAGYPFEKLRGWFNHLLDSDKDGFEEFGVKVAGVLGVGVGYQFYAFSSAKKKYVAETVSGTVVGVIAYSSSMYFSDVPFDQVMDALAPAVVLSAVIGKPYAMYRDAVCPEFGLEKKIKPDT